MRKYLIGAAMAALMLLPEGGLVAQPAESCVTPQEFADAPPIDPHTTLTGPALRQYIDAFNAVSGAQQGYDEFDQLDIYRHGDAVLWVFFNEGCLSSKPVVATPLHVKIMELLTVGPGKGV